MSEYNPHNRFPWQIDAEGEYLKIRSGEGIFELRDSTTLLYLFPDQPEADHIWIQLYEEEEQNMGIRIWRQFVDDALGEGSFSELCDEMCDRGFEIADDEVPSPLDIQAWEEAFDKPYEVRTSVDKLVELALKNFDSAWAYYEGEWHED